MMFKVLLAIYTTRSLAELPLAEGREGDLRKGGSAVFAKTLLNKNRVGCIGAAKVALGGGRTSGQEGTNHLVGSNPCQLGYLFGNVYN